MLINLPRTLAWLDACQLDAIVATSWANVLYCSGYHLWLQPVFKEFMATPGGAHETVPIFAIVTSRGDTALVLDQGWELNAAESCMAQRFVFGPKSSEAATSPETAASGGFCRSPHRYETAFEALAAALGNLQLDDGRLGFEVNELSLGRTAAIKSALPRAEIRDASNLLQLIRMVKSDEELTRLRRSAEINEQAAKTCLARAVPGCQMQDLALEFRTSVATAGADFDHFAFSQQGIGFATDNRYRLGRRETMFVDFGCIYQHYYSDAGVTLVSGELPLRERSTFQVLVDCVHRAAAQLRPGVMASSLQAQMQQSLELAGLTGCFPHGHGIGIELRDYPILAPAAGRRIRDDCVDIAADLLLERNMVINLEAPLFDWHGAAMQLEQSYLVTAGGGKPLTERDLGQPVFAAGR